MQEGSVLHLCTKFEADISFGLKVIKGPKISKLGHVIQATPILGSFCISTQDGSVLHLCTKFEVDCSVCSKVKGSQNLEIRSCDPDHAHLGVVL